MNCKRFERLIALYVEGDLAERQVRKVEFHLAGCAACRRFADELKASQGAMKDLRHETICETDLQAMHRRVIDAVAGIQPNTAQPQPSSLSPWERVRVRVGPSAKVRAKNVDVENKDSNGHAGSWMDGFGARWRWAGVTLASVAVLVMAGVYFSLMYPETPSRLVPEQTVTVREVVPTVPVSPLPQPQLRDEVEAGPADVAVPVVESAAHPPVVIKMLTDNPDVVIILVTNGKEETEYVPKA